MRKFNNSKCWADCISQKDSFFGKYLLLYIVINFLFIYFFYDFLKAEIINNYVVIFGNYTILFGFICYLISFFSNPGYLDNNVNFDTKCVANNEKYNMLMHQYTGYCQICKCWKPPRAHHCRRCQKCVFKMDHHCFFINNCVGGKNTKAFFLFLLYSFISLSIFCVKNYLALYNIGNTWISEKKKISKINFCMFIFWSLYTLKISLYLELVFNNLKDILVSIMFNFTTIEYLKYKRGRPINKLSGFVRIFNIFPLSLIPFNFNYVGNLLEYCYEEDLSENKYYIKEIMEQEKMIIKDYNISKYYFL